MLLRCSLLTSLVVLLTLSLSFGQAAPQPAAEPTSPLTKAVEAFRGGDATKALALLEKVEGDEQTLAAAAALKRLIEAHAAAPATQPGDADRVVLNVKEGPLRYSQLAMKRPAQIEMRKAEGGVAIADGDEAVVDRREVRLGLAGGGLAEAGEAKSEAPTTPAPDAAPPRSPERMKHAAEADSGGGGLFGDDAADEPAPAAKPGAATDRLMEDSDTGASAGTLTAGSLDDLADPKPLMEFAGEQGDRPMASDFTKLNFAIRVVNADDQPLPNAFVLIHDGRDTTYAGLVTGPDGRAALSVGHDQLPPDMHVLATIVRDDGVPFTTSIDPQTPETHRVMIPGAIPDAVNRLDLLFAVDCTGSMGDELNYLKAELKDVVATVAGNHPDANIRLALVVYRDTSDDYITRTSAWTRDVDAFLGLLDAQSANGGGDAPEAVDQALREAADLDWTAEAAARVVFLVGDAPPHDELTANAFSAVDDLRELGVRVYPVLGSTNDPQAQLVWRGAAALTAARHLFLTNDSGVGGDHQEPGQDAKFDVEPLNALMARILDAELRGVDISKGDNVIRRVGDEHPE